LALLNKITKFVLTVAPIIFVAHTAAAQMEFVENKGQWDSKVNFRADFSTGSFFLENKGFTVDLHNPLDLQQVTEQLHGHSGTASIVNNKSSVTRPPQNNTEPSVIVRSHAYKVNFLGSANNIIATPDKVQVTYNNYLLGNDKTKWASNCKVYQAVTYKNVYPNIDVRYYTESGTLKYDLIVRPGGNPNAIAMRYDGVDKLEVKNKELVIGTSVGSAKELSPYTYQSQKGKKETVGCKYAVRDNVVTFKVNNYSPNETLVIDPTIIFSSLTKSPANNWGYTATPGPGGSFFAGGIVFSNGFPVTTGAYQTTFGGGIADGTLNGGYDIGIFKFSANGSQRLYATYIGGNANEQPHSMIADAQGNLIIAGRTNSNNYPDATRPAGRTDYDIVITKLNAAGTAALGAVIIGGSKDDGVNIASKYSSKGAIKTRRNYGDDARSEVILDGAGNIYLASCTQSNDFPVTPGTPIQDKFGNGLQDGQDGVILKFNPNLSTLLFGTYFGGNGDDACFVLAINPLTGNLYVAGGTTSTDLKGNIGGGINNNNQGRVDGFITEVRSDGSGIIKTTYAGTAEDDLIYGIQFDRFGFPYIMGTSRGNWPVINSLYKDGVFGNNHAKQFISKLQPDLSAYVYSTVFGTNSTEPNISPVAFLVDRCQNVYVSGWGGAANSAQEYPTAGTFGMPVKNQLPNLPAPDGNDFYFFVLKRNADDILFGSHFGQNGGFGDHVDGGTSRFDANGIIYQAMCANCGGGAVFPTTAGVFGAVNGSAGGCNEAAVKIEMNFAGVGASVKATIDGVIDTIGCVPLNIKFIDTLAKGKKYVWNFGDVGSPKNDTVTFAPDNSTSHTYNQVGSYRVRLISIDSGTCNIADTAYITVKVGNNQVNPDFSFVKLDSCNSLRYQFTNLTTAALPNYTNKTFTWDFGDGSKRVVSGFGNQIHTFPSVGSYTVTLLVDDTTFCNSPDSTQKMVRINPNVKAIFNTSTRGCVPYTPVFKNNSLGGTDWQWQLSGTTFSTDFEPTYTFTTVGSYEVRLIATDTSTCNKVDTSQYFTITVYPIPTAGFTWSPNPPIENTKTNFTNLSVGATRYLWDFGDGETSTEVNPSYQFNKTDTFNVNLYAFNDADCVDTFSARVPILIRPLLDVPNAFTPGRFSGSGFNNGIVKVEGFGIGKMSWKIYNRWGQVVFATSNRRQGWDGTFKGVVQPMDVYAYTLDVEFTDGQKLRKTGDITLLR
jgi:gliding motility-associated-like protein